MKGHVDKKTHPLTTVYGTGCITTKQTNPGKCYVYAEWRANGKRYCKSCGNIDDPDSQKRALRVLHGVALDKMGAIMEDMRRIQAELAADHTKNR